MCNEKVRDKNDYKSEDEDKYCELQVYSAQTEKAIDKHLVCKACVNEFKDEIYNTDEGNGILKIKCLLCQDTHLISDQDWDYVISILKNACCTIF